MASRKFNISKELELVFTGGNFPQLKIPCIEYEEGKQEREHDYYLSPYRGYRFQVSGDERGGGSYAATPVVGLGNVVLALSNYKAPVSNYSIYANNFTSLIEGIFESFIDSCIDKFESTCDNSFNSFNNAYKILPEFTRASIKYVSDRVADHLPEGYVFTREVTDPEAIDQLNKQFS